MPRKKVLFCQYIILHASNPHRNKIIVISGGWQKILYR